MVTSLDAVTEYKPVLLFFAVFACPVDLREQETGWALPGIQKLEVQKENGRANFVN